MVHILGVTAHPIGGLDHPSWPQSPDGSRRAANGFRLIRDRDNKFTAACDEVFSGNGIRAFVT